MTRTVVVVGLLLLAAFLPLAVLPLDSLSAEPRVFVVSGVTTFAGAAAQPVALLALTHFRAPPPPSR